MLGREAAARSVSNMGRIVSLVSVTQCGATRGLPQRSRNRADTDEHLEACQSESPVLRGLNILFGNNLPVANWPIEYSR